MLSDKFRNLYDHLWYCLAIAAGFFFIADSSSNQRAKDLAEESQYGKQASAYLARQLRDYYDYCTEMRLTNIPSCIWASDVQQKLTDYIYAEPVTFVIFGPKKSQDIYFPYSSDADLKDALIIRKEIKAYNELKCPVRQLNSYTWLNSKSSTVCESIPANFCRSFRDSPKDFIDSMSGDTVALASECILPTLVRSRLIQERLLEKVENDLRNRHLRWLYFLMLSLVVGGKIANVSTKLIAIDNRSACDRRRLVILGAQVAKWGLKAVFAIKRLVLKLPGINKKKGMKIIIN